MAQETFATAINCMDGRTQLPVMQYMQEHYGVDYVDTITEPGPDGILGDGTDTALVESIRRRVDISIRKHGSRNVAVVAHHDCAGNPVDQEVHLEQLGRAVEVVRSWGYGCEVIPLWVDEAWKVHRTDEKPGAGMGG
jgi:hypothetical protein